MAALLFRLRDVSDEEAAAVRTLLADANMAVYETSSGTWGLGVAAIWLRNKNQLTAARALLHAYQQQREAIPQPPVPTHWQHWTQNPVRFFLFCFLIVFMFAVTLWPFFFFS
ncbi:MAG: DUF6164 family protein [Mariprofundaceae bacterium]|nr:DUF6164 family protein [Mariprofundaceae bacterium]